MSVHNFMTIHQIDVKIFLFGIKWWPDKAANQPTPKSTVLARLKNGLHKGRKGLHSYILSAPNK